MSTRNHLLAQIDLMFTGMCVGLIVGLAGGLFLGSYYAKNDADYRRSTERFKACVYNNSFQKGADETAITIRNDCIPLTYQ